MAEKIHGSSISAGTRVYYVDVYLDSKGKPFTVLAEVAAGGPRKDKRQRIFIHGEVIDKVISALSDAKEIMNK